MTKVPPKPRTAIGVPNWAPTDVDILLSLVADTLPLNQQQWQRLAVLYNKHPDRRHERDWEAVKRKFNKLRSSAKLSTDPDCPEDVRLAREIQRDMELKAERQGHDTSLIDQAVEDEMALLESASRAHAFVHGEDEANHGENDEIREGEASSLTLSKPALSSDDTQLGQVEQHDQQQIRPTATREFGARSHLEILARRSRKRAHEEVEPEPTPNSKRTASLHSLADHRAIGASISSELMSVLMLMDERAQIRQEQREEREEARRRQQEAREDARWAALEERYMQERLQREEQRRKDEIRHERSERLQMLLLAKVFGVDLEKELQSHDA